MWMMVYMIRMMSGRFECKFKRILEVDDRLIGIYQLWGGIYSWILIYRSCLSFLSLVSY